MRRIEQWALSIFYLILLNAAAFGPARGAMTRVPGIDIASGEINEATLFAAPGLINFNVASATTLIFTNSADSTVSFLGVPNIANRSRTVHVLVLGDGVHSLAWGGAVISFTDPPPNPPPAGWSRFTFQAFAGNSVVSYVSRSSDNLAVVDTVSALLARNPTSFPTNAITLGRTLRGDGGGGTFYWVGGDTTTANSGTVFESGFTGAPVGRWKREFTGAVNARWFGARVDGGDSTLAVKAAYDALNKGLGGTIHFPPGQYAITNLLITNKNITLDFSSWTKDDSGSGFTTNYITSTDNSQPVITVGDGTNFAKGFRMTGGYFKGNGSTGVGLRLAGGAYECSYDGTQFYGFATNIWVEGTGTVPCSINRFYNGSCLAANIDNSRGLYVAAPDAGTGFTTGTYFTGYHFNSQIGGANRHLAQFDGTSVHMANVYFDFLTNSPILFSQTAGVSVQPPILQCANVSFDGSSTYPVVQEDFGASKRISALVQGWFTFNGQAKWQDGTTSEQALCQSGLENGGNLFSPIIRGPQTFLSSSGNLTNRTWHSLATDEFDETIFRLSNTNGPLAIVGRTNISLATGDGTLPSLYVQPGVVRITNSTTLEVFGDNAGLSELSTSSNRVALRTYNTASANAAPIALHSSSYQNTFDMPLAWHVGLISSNGFYTTAFRFFGNVDASHATRAGIYTHKASTTGENMSIFFDELGGVGIGNTNPSVSAILDLRNAESRFFLPPQFTTAVRDAAPNVENGDMLFNTTTGNFEGRVGGAWVSLGSGSGSGTVTSFSVGNMSPLFTVSSSTTTPTLAAVDPGAHRLYGWDETDNAPRRMLIGANLSYDAATDTLNASAGAGGYTVVQEETVPLTARTAINFVGSAFTAADNGGTLVTDVTADSDLNAVAGLGTTGLMTRTGAGTATTRTLTAGSGVTVTNGDGVAGNPTAALNITGLAAETTIDTANDTIPFYDASEAGNNKMTLDTLKTAVGNITSLSMTGSGSDFTPAAQDTYEKLTFGGGDLEVVLTAGTWAVTATVNEQSANSANWYIKLRNVTDSADIANSERVEGYTSGHRQMMVQRIITVASTKTIEVWNKFDDPAYVGMTVISTRCDIQAIKLSN